MNRKNSKIPAVFLVCLGGLFACENSGTKDHSASKDTLQQNARNELAKFAEGRRQQYESMSFEEFERSVFKENFEGGKYIVNGDTPVSDIKHLKEFYDSNVKQKPIEKPEANKEFIIHQVGGLDAVWPQHIQNNLSYCVSTSFGDRHSMVVEQMEKAANAWEEAANIDFVYLPHEDINCTANNPLVVFDVRPVNVFGRYLARAFFPNESRPNRNILIDDSSFELSPEDELSMQGILRHELGHTLGARHEHTRPDSGDCFEDNDWKPLTDYDAFSVMHYPQCNGKGDWSLTLTHQDKNGVACIYGPAQGFAIDEDAVNDISQCKLDRVSRPSQTLKTKTFELQRVAKGEEKRYSDFAVSPGSVFKAEMRATGTSPGDPDLYLKFDATPTRLEYDCRPYTSGADETCNVSVPDGVSVARIMVRGYHASTYNLTISYLEPGG